MKKTTNTKTNPTTQKQDGSFSAVLAALAKLCEPKRKTLFDLAEGLELAAVDFEYIETLLDEVFYEVAKPIKHDGTSEDEQNKANLIQRRPTLEIFLSIAAEYTKKLKETIRKTAADLYKLDKEQSAGETKRAAAIVPVYDETDTDGILKEAAQK